MSRLTIKRGMDIAVALLLLAVTFPVMVLIAVFIWLETGGPVLHRSRRLGKNGTLFTMYKFRTMVRDAETRLLQLVHLNVADGMIKIPSDPRVTNIGRWLRRFSLDELPQFWNVVRGDMSLVGPRPHEPSDIPVIDDMHLKRLTMRPGITGLWQVTARNDPALSARIYYDLVYVSRWSFFGDLSIIGRTVPAILSGHGGSVVIPQPAIPASRPDEATWLLSASE